MLETLKQIAGCLTDYIGLAKAIILAFIAVIAFLKKLSVRTIYVRALQPIKNSTVTAVIPFFKKIQFVRQMPYNVRHA